MATFDSAPRVTVSPSSSPFGEGWTVVVAGESRTTYSGHGARGRAIEAALAVAEEVRTSGTVLVIVDAAELAEKASRAVPSRLAS